MRNLFPFFTFLAFTSSVAFAQVTIKDVETIDKNDIVITDFEETDMAPAGLVPRKNLKSYIKERQEEGGSFANRISVSVNNHDDLNMEGYLDASPLAVRPEPILIPFFEEYPIQNIEVKFRILNKKF